jgi:hypothetical protein
VLAGVMIAIRYRIETLMDQAPLAGAVRAIVHSEPAR